ncbi:hypothetical protein CYY_000667 [Polysphondylium violaceum]|uniref:non-specific serine/threonine protein kinase n=1 Tax=Polysphondylium violaceum TaxID=133409 RepID=A0A8J4VBB6_9MYCE|nr:hypothetical protein CYY_000667 [Polysphondylium violaceum]
MTTLATTNNNEIKSIENITSLPNSVLLSQGAEAKTYKIDLYGIKCIVKERFVKAYRHPTLDQKISGKRILQEVRSLNKCKKNGIDVPALLLVDVPSNRIYMEYIDGITVKQYLYNCFDQSKETSTTTTQTQTEAHQQQIDICAEIGKQIARIHDLNIVHGDLTTSNMLLRNNSKSNIVFIDFGLSYTSTMTEDKAVDMYVLERAFISTHPNSELLFKEILDSYQKNSPSPKVAKAILDKLDQVRLRGRKKLAFG